MRYFFKIYSPILQWKIYSLFTNELKMSLTYCKLFAEHQQETESVDGDGEGEKDRHDHGTVKN